MKINTKYQEETFLYHGQQTGEFQTLPLRYRKERKYMQFMARGLEDSRVVQSTDKAETFWPRVQGGTGVGGRVRGKSPTPEASLAPYHIVT